MGFDLETYKYDDCNNLIEKTVNQITTRYTLRQDPPFLHMPEWIEEIGLKKIQLSYDQWGHVAQEDLFDSNGNFVYSIFRTYNERGDLLTETNPLSEKTTYQVDDKGHCISIEKGLESQKMIYDRKGRLIEKQENGLHTFRYQYDYDDRLVQKWDSYGHLHSYRYDLICNKVSEIDSLRLRISPPMTLLDEN